MAQYWIWIFALCFVVAVIALTNRSGTKLGDELGCDGADETEQR